MKEVTSNQVISFVIVVFICNKLLILPSLLFNMVGTDGIMIVVSKLAIGVIAALIIVLSYKLCPDATFKDLLESFMGKWGFKIFCVINLIFFITKTFLVLTEGQKFMNSTIYESFDTLLFAIPMFLIGGYVAFKGLRNVARTSEVFVRIILIGLIFTMAIALTVVDFSNLLPLGTHSSSQMQSADINVSMWFGNFLIVALCLGKTKYCKNFGRTMIITSVLSAALAIAFIGIYYSIFGPASGIHQFAISEITEFSPQIASLTKLDWFVVIIWLIALAIQVILQLWVILKLFMEVFSIRKSTLFGFVFFGSLCVIFIIVSYVFSGLIEFAAYGLGIYAYILNIVSIAFLLIGIIVYMIKSKLKTGGKNERILEKE